jgi:hypothetical protein
LSHPVIVKCAVCNDKLKISTLYCGRCNTKYQGTFHLDKFNYLTPEQKYFIEIFLKCRGNIKEVEKELNISYPTVRSRLDDVIRSLGYSIKSDGAQQKSRKEVLEMLSNGELTYEEAMNMLKGYPE